MSKIGPRKFKCFRCLVQVVQGPHLEKHVSSSWSQVKGGFFQMHVSGCHTKPKESESLEDGGPSIFGMKCWSCQKCPPTLLCSGIVVWEWCWVSPKNLRNDWKPFLWPHRQALPFSLLTQALLMLFFKNIGIPHNELFFEWKGSEKKEKRRKIISKPYLRINISCFTGVIRLILIILNKGLLPLLQQTKGMILGECLKPWKFLNLSINHKWY